MPTPSTRPEDDRDDSPELSVRALSTVLMQFELTRGRNELEGLWAQHAFPLPISYFENLNNFVSLRLAENVAETLERASGDVAFARNAGLLSMSPRAMGFAYHLLRAVGTPKLAYQKAIEFVPNLNRIGTFTIERIAHDSMTLRYISSRPERTRVFCEHRQAQFSSVPTIWGMPPAKVIETNCQVTGSGFCRYEFTWINPSSLWSRHFGLVVGVAAAATGYAFDIGMISSGISFAAIAPLLGVLFDSRREVRRKELQIRAHADGLTLSLAEIEARHRELVKAKAEVDKTNRELEERVALRTNQLSRALEEQQRLDRLKTQFFDNVSHELRTPLTLILLPLEKLLSDYSIQTSVRDQLGTVHRSASKLLNLINGLLDLAKLSEGKVRLNYDQVSVGQLLRDLVRSFSSLSERKGVAIKFSTPENLCVVHADEDILESVFQNLISNALKFTGSGGTISIAVSEDESSFLISIADTGVGISAEDLPLLFNRFAQAKDGIRRTGGTGIGLALVKERLELHSGTISVSSEVGKGSTFTVRLPKGTAHIREELRERRLINVAVSNDRRRSSDPLHELANMAMQATTIDSPSPKLNSSDSVYDETTQTLLVVEDNDELRHLVVELLQKSYRVISASNGEDGLQLARQHKPNLVLSDITMPKMSGLQMLAILRADPATSDMPIVLLTSRGETQDKVDGFRMGATDFLTKPFSTEELFARISNLLIARQRTAQAIENERLATIGMFSAEFAHHVRNPLNGLLHALDPLRGAIQSLGNDGRDSSDALTFLGLIEETAQAIHTIAKTLLDCARPIGELSESINVSESLNSALMIVKSKIASNISVERSFSTIGHTSGSPGGLMQVWLNLLDNALRAMPNGGTLVVATQSTDDKVVVSVSDTGVGIRPDHLSRLFQPFFTTRAAGQGTGLGLASCRRIVHQHGGTIDVHSELGKGTTFRVSLPLAKNQLAA